MDSVHLAATQLMEIISGTEVHGGLSGAQSLVCRAQWGHSRWDSNGWGGFRTSSKAFPGPCGAVHNWTGSPLASSDGLLL